MYGGEIRPKIGSPHMFPRHMEEDIALFMKHCTYLRIPKTKQNLKEDILYFVQYKQLDFPRMPEDGPGIRIFLTKTFGASMPDSLENALIQCFLCLAQRAK